MTGKKIWRLGLYLLGQFVLAVGITLNIKCTLGTSAVSAIPHFVSLVWEADFGSCVLVFYLACVAVQLGLKPRGQRLPVLGQIPVSFMATALLNALELALAFQPVQLWEKLLLMLGGVTFTGIGAAMTLNAKLIPNPGDGIVEALGQRLGISTGLAKNFFDLFCVAVTFALGLATGHFMLVIGVGTLVGVVGVGRVISLFNTLCKKPLDKLMGLE